VLSGGLDNDLEIYHKCGGRSYGSKFSWEAKMSEKETRQVSRELAIPREQEGRGAS